MSFTLLLLPCRLTRLMIDYSRNVDIYFHCNISCNLNWCFCGNNPYILFHALDMYRLLCNGGCLHGQNVSQKLNLLSFNLMIRFSYNLSICVITFCYVSNITNPTATCVWLITCKISLLKETRITSCVCV